MEELVGNVAQVTPSPSVSVRLKQVFVLLTGLSSVRLRDRKSLRMSEMIKMP